MPETEEEQTEQSGQQTIGAENSTMQHIIKLLIIMLLTYVIIFM